MKLVDLNVLLYAVNRSASQHAIVSRWWEAALNDDESVGLPWIVLLGFLRLATPRVFATPLAPDTAFSMIDAHLAALAMSHDATLVSCDRDFGRFRGLRWQHPIGTRPRPARGGS